MNRLVILVISLSSLVTILSAKNITGRVICEGKGVEGVQISNGIDIALTDKKGNFNLPDSESSSMIFYTLPSGYESPVHKGIPQFYKKKNTNENKIEFQIKKSEIPQDNHAFVVWADPQVLDLEEVELLKYVRDDLYKTSSLYAGHLPFHAISCGDNVFDHLYLFDHYKDLFESASFPFYQLLGNHDMDYNNTSNYKSDSTYTDKFGPSYYSFNKGRIHYIVLKDVFYYGDSYKYIGYVDEQQLAWLKKDLSFVNPGTTVVLSVHIPTVYGDSERASSELSMMRNSVMNNKALFALLAPYNVHIMAGHSHIQWNTIIKENIFEHVHGAASGAWWQGPVGLDGTPKGYTVYEVKGDSIQWYFKGLDHKKEDQFKIYPQGEDPDNPDCFVVNVYNYDPLWKVRWYENGVLKGEMEQFWGKDPLANELYQPGKNKKHSWLSAGQTNHLFRASPTNRDSKIEVEVIDRFGKLYRSKIN